MGWWIIQGGTKAKLGKRWRFPYPYTTSSYTGPRIGGTFYHAWAYDLLSCEAMCDSDAECKGVYHSATECFTLHALVECDTELSGESYTRNLTAASPHHGGEPVRETWGQLPFRHLTELSCLLTRNQNLMRRAWVGACRSLWLPAPSATCVSRFASLRTAPLPPCTSSTGGWRMRGVRSPRPCAQPSHCSALLILA